MATDTPGLWARHARTAATLVAAASLILLPAQTATATDGVFQNTEDVYISDMGPSVTSPIEVTGVSGNAPTDLRVTVDIEHGARGDLVIELISPDGTVHLLKDDLAFDWEPYTETTYTVTWQLRVEDVWGYFWDGYLRGWQLTF